MSRRLSIPGAGLLLLLGLLLGISSAQAQTFNGEALRPIPSEEGQELILRAQNLYEYGDYQGMVDILETGLEAERFSDADLLAVHRLLGSGYVILQDRAKASEHFLRLLTRDPELALDPLYTPPDIIAFFERVRDENREMLNAIIERRREDEEARRRVEIPPPVTSVRLRHNPYFVNFIPFGAGQFQNDQPVKGTLFLTGELIALALNIVAYLVSDSLKGTDGYYGPTAARQAREWRIVQYSSLGVLAALVIGGTADAIVNYREFTPLPDVAASPEPEAAPPRPEPEP